VLVQNQYNKSLRRLDVDAFDLYTMIPPGVSYPNLELYAVQSFPTNDFGDFFRGHPTITELVLYGDPDLIMRSALEYLQLAVLDMHCNHIIHLKLVAENLERLNKLRHLEITLTDYYGEVRCDISFINQLLNLQEFNFWVSHSSPGLTLTPMQSPMLNMRIFQVFSDPADGVEHCIVIGADAMKSIFSLMPNLKLLTVLSDNAEVRSR
jgi:hypothetical protein